MVVSTYRVEKMYCWKFLPLSILIYLKEKSNFHKKNEIKSKMFCIL